MRKKATVTQIKKVTNASQLTEEEKAALTARRSAAAKKGAETRRRNKKAMASQSGNQEPPPLNDNQNAAPEELGNMMSPMKQTISEGLANPASRLPLGTLTNGDAAVDESHAMNTDMGNTEHGEVLGNGPTSGNAHLVLGKKNGDPPTAVTPITGFTDINNDNHNGAIVDVDKGVPPVDQSLSNDSEFGIDVALSNTPSAVSCDTMTAKSSASATQPSSVSSVSTAPLTLAAIMASVPSSTPLGSENAVPTMSVNMQSTTSTDIQPTVIGSVQSTMSTNVQSTTSAGVQPGMTANDQPMTLAGMQSESSSFSASSTINEDEMEIVASNAPTAQMVGSGQLLPSLPQQWSAPMQLTTGRWATANQSALAALGFSSTPTNTTPKATGVVPVQSSFLNANNSGHMYIPAPAVNMTAVAPAIHAVPFGTGIQIIPRPRCESFNLKRIMGLERRDDDYNTIKNTVHHAAHSQGIDFHRKYRNQDIEVISAVCKEVRALQPYMTRDRFPGDWATKYLIRQYILNYRKHHHLI
ncbi:hypothetical protein FISHEDRAFT_58653 [Fistulina hepatica ATCC 64428]|uniref:Uncharacterized protein n=1 Tax=Fistulina hepatica ATCC 64428 TaxID=1128425 RepID=A0A0D7ADT0_9AGAR|nr:hypothetical protein FISHEDRAFT_58653 [Fistulina hepatica ATCC 64428]